MTDLINRADAIEVCFKVAKYYDGDLARKSSAQMCGNAICALPAAPAADVAALDAAIRAAKVEAWREAAQASHDATTHPSVYACKAAILALIEREGVNLEKVLKQVSPR